MRLIPQESISEFFSEYVDGWLIGDLRYCAAQQQRNLSFTVASLALNALDFFGGLYCGKDSSKACFQLFVNRYMPHYRELPDLYESYRCGLVHEYFPKNQYAVVWSDPGKHLAQPGGRWCLNAQSLAADVENAIAAYRDDLLTDAELHEKFSNRMCELLTPNRVQLTAVGAANGSSISTAPAVRLFSWLDETEVRPAQQQREQKRKK